MQKTWRQDRGDVILGGLAHTALFLLLLALVCYEVGAVLVNHVQLDGIAEDAARTAAHARASRAGSASVEQAVRESLTDERRVVLEAVTYDSHEATVSISRAPLFLLAHRVPTVDDRFRGRATNSAPIP